MTKKLSYEAKEKMVALSGTCFWYWDSFYRFLDSCGVSRALQKRYPRDAYNKYQMMRSILEDLDQAGNHEIINSIASAFYRLKTAIDRDNLDEKKARRLLEEFRDLMGDDPIEAEIKKREQEKTKATYQQVIANRRAQSRRLEDINAEFIRLSTANELTPQKRGYKLEALFIDLLHFSEFEHAKPYRTPDGEQIDGHFKYEKFDYLVEVKWTKDLTKQKDLSIFDGKIRGKAQSTRGFFISATGFDENAINKFSGDAPRIVLMNGEDMALVLGGQVLFADAMRAKIDAIVRHGNIFFPLRKITT